MADVVVVYILAQMVVIRLHHDAIASFLSNRVGCKVRQSICHRSDIAFR